MSIESIVLLILALLATIKAYFEWRKAKIESTRADNTENILRHTIESVETAKNKLDIGSKISFTANMHNHIKESDIDADIINSIVKEVTDGGGDIAKLTRKFKKQPL